jgi:hypothetical protein
MRTAFEKVMRGLDEVQSFLAGERKAFKAHVPDEADVKNKLSAGQGPFAYFITNARPKHHRQRTRRAR